MTNRRTGASLATAVGLPFRKWSNQRRWKSVAKSLIAASGPNSTSPENERVLLPCVQGPTSRRSGPFLLFDSATKFLMVPYGQESYHPDTCNIGMSDVWSNATDQFSSGSRQ